jgi:hypothetical protein
MYSARISLYLVTLCCNLSELMTLAVTGYFAVIYAACIGCADRHRPGTTKTAGGSGSLLMAPR